jgi:integrase
MAKKLPTFITQEEFEKIYEKEEDKKYRLAFLLGFESGLRISEIVGLKNKDGTYRINPLAKEQIDLERGTLKVISGKGEKDRVVSLPKRFNKLALALLPLNKSRRALEYEIKNLGKNILNKEIHFHSLRHSFGSHLANKIPLHQLQMLMGHSRLDTTGIYLHANPQEAIKNARDNF